MKMKLELAITLIVLTSLLTVNDAKKSSGRRTGGSSSSNSRGSYSRNPTSRPSGGSNPGSIGWNVPKAQQPSISKSSAPHSEQISKTSATNVQSSGYRPSGGYGQQTGGAFGQQSAGHNPSAPYPPGGSHSNPSVPHYNSPGGQPPSYGSAVGHPPSYGSAVGHPPSYGSAVGHPPSYGSAAGHPPSYGGAVGQPSHYGTPGGHQPYGQSYHPPQYGGNSPNYHQPYQPNSYNPSYGHSYTPGAGYNPPVGGFAQPQTILVQSGQSSRGIGQIAKEALVFSAVGTGVQAIASRVLPGGIFGTSGHSYSSAPAAGVVPGPSHTEITYNNYYNNGTPGAVAPGAPVPSPVNNQPGGSVAADPIVPAQSSSSNANPPPATGAAAPAPAPAGPTNNNPSQPNQPAPPAEEIKFTSQMGRDTYPREIEQLSEELLTKDVNNAFKYVTMNLQGKKTDGSMTDDAPEHLLTVTNDAWEIPTVKNVIALLDNYELDAKVKEIVSEQEREEENTLVNSVADTDVMKRTMKFLMEKGYISDDTYEFKNALKRIWFTQFKRTEADAGSSAFETIFLAEKIDSEIIGLHNWIYYAKKEADNNLNYLGYIQNTPLGDKGSVVKVRSRLYDTPQDVTTLFVGTSPELEMSLYTLCYYISPNYPCPIKLAGEKFIISTSRVIYYDKDILVSAYPELWIPPPPPPVQNSVRADEQQNNGNPPSSDMSNRRLIAAGDSKSGSESRIYSNLFQNKIALLVLFILFKIY